MAYKNREKPYTLVMLEALGKRMELSNEDRMNQQHSVSGIEGEYKLDAKTETLKHCRVLNDLFLKTNGSSFQIDALVITSKKILLYEVKNYEGEYIYQGDQLHKIKTGMNILNPVSRLTRTKLLFEQLLRKNGFANIQVEAYVVFIHPHFTLYDCPVQQPILFASNVDQHFEQLAAEEEPLSQRFNLLSERLCELVVPDEIDFNLPKYTYKELQKGLFCSICGAVVPSPLGKFTTCQHCLAVVPTAVLIRDHIRDFQYLFPDEAVTISAVYNWCGGKVSKRRLRSVLQSRFQQKSVGRGVYYV